MSCRILMIIAHPDDEGIFFGGTIPYYCRVKKVPVSLLCLTHRESHRSDELRDACKTYGLQGDPVFEEFPDCCYQEDLQCCWKQWGGRLFVVRRLVNQIRKLRPDVILCHDFNGEYGHPNHMAAGIASAQAAHLASSDYFSSQSDSPPWNVKKCYVHLWPHNPHYHEWDTNYKELDDKTARYFTNLGLQCHKSQSREFLHVDGEKGLFKQWSSQLWGLYFSRVGKDTVSNDFLQNIVPAIH